MENALEVLYLWRHAIWTKGGGFVEEIIRKGRSTQIVYSDLITSPGVSIEAFEGHGFRDLYYIIDKTNHRTFLYIRVHKTYQTCRGLCRVRSSDWKHYFLVHDIFFFISVSYLKWKENTWTDYLPNVVPPALNERIVVKTIALRKSVEIRVNRILFSWKKNPLPL